MHSIDLSGKTALVTGGTRNIGRAIAQHLAEAGADVALFYRVDDAAARTLHKQGLAILQELGDRQGIAWSLEGFAFGCAAMKNVWRAARLWGAAERLRQEIGAPMPPQDRPNFEGRVAAARAALLDDAAFDSAWAEGRAMTVEQAIELALQEAETCSPIRADRGRQTVALRATRISAISRRLKQ